MTIIEALADRALLAALPAFRDLASWRAWLVFLAAVYGLALSALRDVGVPEAEALGSFRAHTGRTTYDPPVGGYREAVCIVGRQSGKTRVAATIAAFEAMMAPSEADATETYALLVAQDHRAALRTLFAYARAPFDRVAVLRRSVAARRAETITLESGCTLAVYPCRPAAVRGIRARVVVLDELAFYRSSEGFPTDAEMLRAVRPTLATTGGRLIILSSPYAQSGALYELHRRHFGRDDSNMLVWQASAPTMNPTLPPTISRECSRAIPRRIAVRYSVSFARASRFPIRDGTGGDHHLPVRLPTARRPGLVRDPGPGVVRGRHRDPGRSLHRWRPDLERREAEPTGASQAFTMFTLPWKWEGQEAVVESRTTDDNGDIQPSLAELRQIWRVTPGLLAESHQLGPTLQCHSALADRPRRAGDQWDVSPGEQLRPPGIRRRIGGLRR